MTNRQVLLLILVCVTLTLGSFIWYIVTWDADQRADGVPTDASTFILAQKLPPEAPILAKGTDL